MPLKPASSQMPILTSVEEIKPVSEPQPPTTPYPGTNKDTRILFQGLTQAALQSMPLGQFAPDVETHLKNVMATVDALAVFILDRSK